MKAAVDSRPLSFGWRLLSPWAERLSSVQELGRQAVMWFDVLEVWLRLDGKLHSFVEAR